MTDRVVALRDPDEQRPCFGGVPARLTSAMKLSISWHDLIAADGPAMAKQCPQRFAPSRERGVTTAESPVWSASTNENFSSSAFDVEEAPVVRVVVSRPCSTPRRSRQSASAPICPAIALLLHVQAPA